MNKKFLLLILLFASLSLSGCTLVNFTTNKLDSTKEAYEFKVPTKIYCDHKGSVPKIVSNLYGEIREICIFEDKSECEQWDYYMRDCLAGDNPPIEVQLYFVNQKLDLINLDAGECGEVYPIAFEVGKYQNWERLTLNKLLEGLTQEDIDEGYGNLINPDAKLNSFVFEDNILKLDFSKDIKEDIETDCQKKILKDQFEMTMEQFGSISEVKILIEGEEDNFLDLKNEIEN